VIQGSSQAIVDGQKFAVEPESVLWLEPGEQYQFIAAETELQILPGFTADA
jgi:hypothetical protein